MSIEADIRLRKALMHLAQGNSVAAVKAALILAEWDGVEVPSKVKEMINDMDSEKPPGETIQGT